MGIINAERFADIISASPRLDMNLHGSHNSLRYQVLFALGLQWTTDSVQRVNAAIDRQSAAVLFDQIKQRVMERGHLGSKYMRPWEVDTQLYDNLDRSEPWLGFEFELGFRSQEARAASIEYAWDNFDNVTFDPEGEGSYLSEITFAPQEMSKILDGSAQSVRFMRYIAESGNGARGGGTMVGTHVNISHPFYADGLGAGGNNYALIQSAFGRTMAAIPMYLDNGYINAREYLFGRSSLYGGWYGRGSTRARWLEGKLFRTTYDFDQFQQYVKVSKAFVDIVEAIANFKGDRAGLYATNLLGMVLNDEPVELARGTGGGQGLSAPGEIHSLPL